MRHGSCFRFSSVDIRQEETKSRSVKYQYPKPGFAAARPAPSEAPKCAATQPKRWIRLHSSLRD